MSRNVFILGAGASKESGAPLMRDFLDVAADLARLESAGNSKESFDLVSKGRACLQNTHSKSTSIDLYNMEAVFSAFEMAKMLGKLPGLSPEEINNLPLAYRAVIAKTLEEKIVYKISGRQINPGIYGKFIETIKVVNDLTKGDTSILTFNYDIAADFACHYHGVRIDYGLDESVKKGHLRLLKLHGSLNWTICGGCKKVVAWPLNEWFAKYHFNLDRAESVKIQMSETLSNFAHCGIASVPSYPFIVPPTWNKSEHHHEIESVWRHAANELAEAENIFIFGYSLPETDTFFHYLFSLGTNSEQIIRRFWVFDPNGNVEQKYKKILSTNLLSRFQFFNSSFSTSLPLLVKELKL